MDFNRFETISRSLFTGCVSLCQVTYLIREDLAKRLSQLVEYHHPSELLVFHTLYVNDIKFNYFRRDWSGCPYSRVTGQLPSLHRTSLDSFPSTLWRLVSHHSLLELFMRIRHLGVAGLTHHSSCLPPSFTLSHNTRGIMSTSSSASVPTSTVEQLKTAVVQRRFNLPIFHLPARPARLRARVKCL